MNKELTNIEKIDLALKNRLYVSGWLLSKYLDFIREEIKKDKVRDKDYIISLSFKEERPIGIAIFSVKSNDLMVFVRKSERKKGIGTFLIRDVRKQLFELNKDLESEIFFSEGIKGSENFFVKTLEKTKLEMLNKLVNKNVESILNSDNAPQKKIKIN